MEKRIYYLQLNQLLIDFFNQKHLDSSFKKTSTDISEQWSKAIWTQLFSFSSLSSHVHVLSNYTCQDRIVNYLYKYGRLVNPSCEDKLAGVRISQLNLFLFIVIIDLCIVSLSISLRYCFNSKVSSCPHFTSCPWQVFTINILFQLVLGTRNFQCFHIFPSVLRGKYCRGTTHVKENPSTSKHGTFILSSPQGPFLLEALCLIFKFIQSWEKKCAQPNNHSCIVTTND